MLLSIMDGAELDLNNTLISSSSKPSATTTTSSISTSDDYEKDLQLAAELGRCLLERNQELQNYVEVLQKQIDDEQCNMKLLHAKLESTREQLDAKCKQTEVLDANNIDLERELARQRRENEIERQRTQELTDLCEKTRKKYLDVEYEYEKFRSKQFQNQFFPKQLRSPVQTVNISTPKSTKLQRSRSFDSNIVSNASSSSSSSDVTISPTLFDASSASIFKAHLTELKSRIHSLTAECSRLNEKADKSNEEKRYLIDRITYLERQRRDDNDSLQNELNHCRKLLEKYTNDESSNAFLSNIYSPPEHEISLYDEVLLENKKSNNKPSYEPTNYKDLFARVYEKLKISNNNTNDG